MTPEEMVTDSIRRLEDANHLYREANAVNKESQALLDRAVFANRLTVGFCVIAAVFFILGRWVF